LTVALGMYDSMKGTAMKAMMATIATTSRSSASV